MTEDLEYSAIGSIIKVLEPLDLEARDRVLEYVLKRFSTNRAAQTLSAPSGHVDSSSSAKPTKSAPRRKSSRTRISQPSENGSFRLDLAALVNHFKNREDYNALDEAVFQNEDRVNRIIFALAMYREVNGDTEGMTSGDIQKFYRQLGVSLGQPNISGTLSGRAKQFVLSEGVRKKGAIIRYRLSRHGVEEARNLKFLSK